MKIKKRNIKIFFVLLFILVGVYVLFLPSFEKKDSYQFSGNTLNYLSNRGSVEYSKSLIEKNDSFDVYSINFLSRSFMDSETRIYGLLFMPKVKGNFPGLVYLPGGGVTKEGVKLFSSRIAEEGYAVLVIDQRGIGETGGIYLNFDQDYRAFSQGYEPIQHLSVYDGLRTYDVLRSIPGIDKNNVGFLGESMGGRYAIASGAIEKRSKGVIVISSSGFHIPEDKSMVGNDYLVSVDPDHYVKGISPRYFMVLQGDNDSVTKLDDAKITYNLANEPKRMFVAKGCGHGFCEKMWDELLSDLKILFGE